LEIVFDFSVALDDAPTMVWDVDMERPKRTPIDWRRDEQCNICGRELRLMKRRVILVELPSTPSRSAAYSQQQGRCGRFTLLGTLLLRKTVKLSNRRCPAKQPLLQRSDLCVATSNENSRSSINISVSNNHISYPWTGYIVNIVCRHWDAPRPFRK
jgi:hypothetical protein